MRGAYLLLVAAALAIGCDSSDGAATDAGDNADSDAAVMDAATGDAAAGDATSTDGALTGDWLLVKGAHIVHTDGTPFRGRGANLHDERSCEACSFAPADPLGVNRWADDLIDVWHASFIRFLLSSKAAPFNSSEVQYKSIVDDPAYYADIQTNVNHMTSKGAYVLVTLFADPTIKPDNSDYDSEWPGSAGDTYQAAIDTIRKVEDSGGTPHHVIVVQAPEGWARDLTYFVAHPFPGDNVAYEVHPYNAQTDFDALLVQPAKTLPIIIGEYGPAGSMTTSDITALWTVAQANDIPHIGWNFHMRCPPNMLQDTASDGCGLDVSTGYAFPRTSWGDQAFAYLNTPW